MTLVHGLTALSKIGHFRLNFGRQTRFRAVGFRSWTGDGGTVLPAPRQESRRGRPCRPAGSVGRRWGFCDNWRPWRGDEGSARNGPVWPRDGANYRLPDGCPSTRAVV